MPKTETGNDLLYTYLDTVYEVQYPTYHKNSLHYIRHMVAFNKDIVNVTYGDEPYTITIWCKDGYDKELVNDFAEKFIPLGIGYRIKVKFK